MQFISLWKGILVAFYTLINGIISWNYSRWSTWNRGNEERARLKAWLACVAGSVTSVVLLLPHLIELIYFISSFRCHYSLTVVSIAWNRTSNIDDGRKRVAPKLSCYESTIAWWAQSMWSLNIFPEIHYAFCIFWTSSMFICSLIYLLIYHASFLSSNRRENNFFHVYLFWNIEEGNLERSFVWLYEHRSWRIDCFMSCFYFR